MITREEVQSHLAPAPEGCEWKLNYKDGKVRLFLTRNGITIGSAISVPTRKDTVILEWINHCSRSMASDYLYTTHFPNGTYS